MTTAPDIVDDPILTEVVRHALETIAEEMRTSLYRTAVTTVVKDMLDYSCALFDRDGRLLAAALDIPTLLASMGSGLAAIQEKWGEDIAGGDILMTNDPYNGGTHTPDIYIFAPVFDANNELVGFAGNIAHHGDWGGRVPGTVSAANRSVYEEGVIMPAVKLKIGGEPNAAVYDIMTANLRQPRLNLGDLRAQLASAEIGRRGLEALTKRYGTDELRVVLKDLLRYTELRTSQAIAELPDGVYEAEDFLDDDGVDIGNPVRLHVRITIEGSNVEFDFNGCAEERIGGMNCPIATTRSSVQYALKSMLPEDIPFNDGCAATVTIAAREGSIVNPSRPRATGDRHLTQQRVSDICIRALTQAAPGKGSAAWFSGWPFIVCESTSPKTQERVVLLANIGGGAGANPSHDGADGVDVHGANCAIIPAETIETNYPLRVSCYELIPDSGGPGTYRGGLGIRADYQVVGDEPIVIQSEAEQSRNEFAPAPMDKHGFRGTTSFISVIDNNGHEHPKEPKSMFTVHPGETVSLRAGGGGGYGDPRKRSRALVQRDLQTGRVSAQAAEEIYGFVREQ